MLEVPWIFPEVPWVFPEVSMAIPEVPWKIFGTSMEISGNFLTFSGFKHFCLIFLNRSSQMLEKRSQKQKSSPTVVWILRWKNWWSPVWAFAWTAKKLSYCESTDVKTEVREKNRMSLKKIFAWHFLWFRRSAGAGDNPRKRKLLFGSMPPAFLLRPGIGRAPLLLRRKLRTNARRVLPWNGLRLRKLLKKSNPIAKIIKKIESNCKNY